MTPLPSSTTAFGCGVYHGAFKHMSCFLDLCDVTQYYCVVRYTLVPVMHFEQVPAGGSGDDVGVTPPAAPSKMAAALLAHKARRPVGESFGTPFVVAISNRATFADAYSAVVAEAQRFIRSASRSGKDQLPFRVAIANAGSTGSARNPKKLQGFPFDFPPTHPGRICIGEVDDLKVDETFVLVWQDRKRDYADDQDRPLQDEEEEEDEEAEGGLSLIHI